MLRCPFILCKLRKKVRLLFRIKSHFRPSSNMYNLKLYLIIFQNSYKNGLIKTLKEDELDFNQT
jgi:hypothetical protein